MPSEVLAVGDAEVLVITETVVELLEVATQGPPGSGSGGPAAWNDITGKPSTFPPSVHTHTIDAVTGLQTALDGKQAVLVNQNNIKSINGVSLLGSGDITVGGGGTPAWADITGKPTTLTGYGVTDAEPSIPKAIGYAKWNGSAWVFVNENYMQTSHAANGIAGSDIADWNAAFGWGNHATAGYTSNLGTVTAVAALTLGTSGTDVGSSVATGTTTPVITLNIPTASAVNRGALSSTDWSTFNGKQSTADLSNAVDPTKGATLVGYLPTGTGAVGRTVKAKLQEFVSSADFSTLQEAANYACANAKNLHIDGNYTISTAVVFDSDAITVTGNGPRSSVITTSSATADIFVFGNGSTLRHGITVRDIGFNTSIAKSAGISLKLNKVNQAVIDNIWIGSPFCGISILDSTLVRVRDVEIDNPTATTGIGWLIDGTTGNDQSLSNVFVAGNVGAQPLCGGRIRHSGGVWLDNVGTIWGGSAGLLVDPANGQSVLNVFSSRCAWDSCSGSGMLVQPTGTGSVMRWGSNGDWFATNTLHGFSTAGTSTISGFTFHAPRFFNNGRHGASIARGTGFYFTTPKAAGNSTSTSNTYDGINIAAGIFNFAVSGGKSGPSDGFTDIQRYGVYIAAGASDGYSVTNVDLTGNLTGGLFDGGTGLSKVVYQNIGAGTAIVPNAVPSVDWGIDFAKRGVTVVANGTPYALASGSGLVMLHNNGTGAMGLFMAYAGTVTKVAGDATMVSGAAGANRIGLAYNVGGYYQVSNGYVASQQVYIATIKTRTAS